jgi:hypothetical protein
MAKTNLKHKLYYGFLLVVLLGWIRFLLLGERNDNKIDLTHARKVILTPQQQSPVSGNSLTSGENSSIEFDEYINIDTGLLEALQSGFENTAINEISFVQTGGRSLLQDIDLLIKAYNKNQAPEILPPLITKLLRVYQFEEANKYLTLYLNSLSMDQISLVSSQAIFYTLLNTPSIINNLDVKRGQIIDFIMQQRQERLITESDKIFYETLLEITTGNVMPLITAIRTINDPLYANIKKDLLDNYRIYTSIPQQPRYYLRALVALTLMKHGYFKIAEQLALSALIDNKNYLLPYQILAYSHFVTNERTPAREYLFRLVDLDQTNERSYKFMIGITFFWQQNYTQALLYFSQVKQSEFMLDTIRYKILSYHELNDNRNLVTTMRELLNTKQADALDLLQLFELLFFEPYQQ